MNDAPRRKGPRGAPDAAWVCKMTEDANWPVEIKLSKDGRTLSIGWGDGRTFATTAELLRVESPSAEVQGHSPEQKTIVPGKRNVAIRDVEEVGVYAVRLVFDDGHNTGIYTWRSLRAFGERGDEMFSDYEQALADLGLRR